MWRARKPPKVNKTIITPPAKHHYGGKDKKPNVPIWQTPLYQKAAKSVPTEAQIRELSRLGVSEGRMPQTRLGAARALKRIKMRIGELK